ncbi:MAG: DUF3566 domain-containing protein [Bowdeniella nasicola]|nr:DUF3566 domain-containing protein [Bowdeniella nasicola]
MSEKQGPEGRSEGGVNDTRETAVNTPPAPPSKVTLAPRRGTGETIGLNTDYRVISRVDPWSVMKLGFLLSIALGIMTVIAAAIAWLLLDSFHVFSSISEIVGEIDTSSGEFSKLIGYLHFDKVISMATIVAIVNTILLTVLMTIGAFIYNIVAALVGGIHVTLEEE